MSCRSIIEMVTVHYMSSELDHRLAARILPSPDPPPTTFPALHSILWSQVDKPNWYLAYQSTPLNHCTEASLDQLHAQCWQRGVLTNRIQPIRNPLTNFHYEYSGRDLKQHGWIRRLLHIIGLYRDGSDRKENLSFHSRHHLKDGEASLWKRTTDFAEVASSTGGETELSESSHSVHGMKKFTRTSPYVVGEIWTSWEAEDIYLEIGRLGHLASNDHDMAWKKKTSV
jgi:hypothetical protein